MQPSSLLYFLPFWNLPKTHDKLTTPVYKKNLYFGLQIGKSTMYKEDEDNLGNYSEQLNIPFTHTVGVRAVFFFIFLALWKVV